VRLALFVDGCFWHGCPKHATKPKNNASFWRKKLAGNKRRDELVTRTLRRAGWKVVRIWECALQRAIKPGRTERPSGQYPRAAQQRRPTKATRLLQRIQRELRRQD